MVEVRVARDHEVEALDAEGRERGRHHRAAEIEATGERRAAVHEERAFAALHEHRVARAHVEDHEARRLGRERGRGRGAEQRDPGDRRSDPEQPASRGEPGEGEDAHAGEDDRPRRGSQRRCGQKTRQRAHGREGPVRRRERHGEHGPERRRRTARDEGRAEGEGEHDPARPRHGDQVHDEGEGGHDSQVERGEGRGREDRARRGGQEVCDPVAHAGPRRRGIPARSRGEHERRARREGHLRTRVEEGFRLARQDHEGGQGEGMAAAGRSRPRHGHRRREDDHEGATHRHVEAGEERVRHRERRGEDQRLGAHVEARGERGGAHEDPPRDREDEGGQHGEVQPGDREEVRDAEHREALADLRAEARALAEGERGEQRAALAARLEPLGGASAQRVEPRQWARTFVVHDARVKPGVHQAPDRPDARAREPALLAPAAGVVPVPGRAQPHARAHAIPRQRALEGSDTGRCRGSGQVHARRGAGRGGIEAPHAVQLHAERPATSRHGAHRAFERRQELGPGPRLGRGLELPGEARAAGAEGGEQQRERARPGAPSRREGAGEEHGPAGGGERPGDAGAVGDEDAERVREREGGKTGQGRGRRGPGPRILPDLRGRS